MPGQTTPAWCSPAGDAQTCLHLPGDGNSRLPGNRICDTTPVQLHRVARWVGWHQPVRLIRKHNLRDRWDDWHKRQPADQREPVWRLVRRTSREFVNYSNARHPFISIPNSIPPLPGPSSPRDDVGVIPVIMVEAGDRRLNVNPGHRHANILPRKPHSTVFPFDDRRIACIPHPSPRYCTLIPYPPEPV